jgi:hypothetical protein
MRVGGRQRWLTIGRHGSPWTPENARREALRLLGLKAAGHDPASERDRQKGAITIAELGNGSCRNMCHSTASQGPPRNISAQIEKYINPIIGRHRIADLTRSDVAQLHHHFRDRPYQANRSLAVLSKMMNLAEAWGLRPDGSNPVRHVKKYREDKRERYLTKAELQRLGAVLADAKTKAKESSCWFSRVRASSKF